MLAFGIIAPVLPLLIKQFEAAISGERWTLLGLWIRLATCNLFSHPCWEHVGPLWRGRLSDFLRGTGLRLHSDGLAPTLGWLFVGRSFRDHYFNISTAFAYVNDVTPRSAAPSSLDYQRGFRIGFVIGRRWAGYWQHSSAVALLGGCGIKSG